MLVKNRYFFYLSELQKRWMEDLPGGTIEEGESVIDGAIREVQEEAGLSLKKIKLLTTHEWQHPSGKTVLEYILCAVVDTQGY